MTLFHRFARVALATAIVTGTVSTASAQSFFWDWGGSQTVDGAGKERVSFSSAYRPGEIIVSFGDRRLYHVTAPGQADSYPIAVPREQSRWQGVTSISSKRENPSWTPTPTMRKENPRLPMWVPGGHPMNPLGVRALYLGSSMYRIHGTDAPWTIGTAASKGCIRMYNQDVIDLYNRTRTGAKVTVTWQKFQGGGVATSSGSSPRPAAAMRKTTGDDAAQARRYYRTSQQQRRAAERPSTVE